MPESAILSVNQNFSRIIHFLQWTAQKTHNILIKYNNIFLSNS